MEKEKKKSAPNNVEVGVEKGRFGGAPDVSLLGRSRS
jgi:hypothetical protein